MCHDKDDELNSRYNFVLLYHHFLAFRAFLITLNRATHSFFDFPVTSFAILLQRSFFSMLDGYICKPICNCWTCSEVHASEASTALVDVVIGSDNLVAT
mmetsp:Transcript_27515/g.28039  ORF Transcript_27515/g.28039 Transcript_27515/m.28039 type:complete len:99 (-) Transcript_27515:1458-1754(-)